MICAVAEESKVVLTLYPALSTVKSILSRLHAWLLAESLNLGYIHNFPL